MRETLNLSTDEDSRIDKILQKLRFFCLFLCVEKLGDFSPFFYGFFLEVMYFFFKKC